MIENENIICFGNTTWEGDYVKSTVKLLTQLSKKNRILYISYPFTHKDILFTMLSLQQAPVKRMLRIQPALRKVETEAGSEIYYLTLPPAIPFIWIKNSFFFNLILKFNSGMFSKTIRKTIEKLNFSDPIYINAFNQFYGKSLLNKFNAKANIYYCYDHINTNRDGMRGIQYEEKFIPLVDGVITSSANLKMEKSKLNPSCYLVKNGVDFDQFSHIANVPKETGGKKIVGYIGSLDFRFHTEYVRAAIEQFPEYEFQFVGRNDNSSVKKALCKYPNVKFLGPVPHHKVPEIMRNCHVGLIPYTKSDSTKNVYPLKINEYLAVGTPVVMTHFADLPEFNNIVSIVDNVKDFCSAIQKEIENPDDNKISDGLLLAKQNSWENRGKQFADAVARVLVKKDMHSKYASKVDSLNDCSEIENEVPQQLSEL